MSGAATGDFAGRAAIVTGGASGIGRAVAVRLAAEGAAVAVADVSADRVRETTEAIAAETPGARVLGQAVDVRDAAAVDALRDRVLQEFGRIDILVASAGILRGVPGKPQTLADTTAEAWDKVIDTNLTGTFLTNRAVLPAMLRQRRGDIVNLSSASGRKGLAYDAAYCASKFGVIGFSEALAEEVRPAGVRVQVVLPEAVDTPLLDQNGPIFRPKGILSADNVADLVLYLLGLPDDTVMLTPMLGSFKSRR